MKSKEHGSGYPSPEMAGEVRWGKFHQRDPIRRLPDCSDVLYLFRMPESRVIVELPELERNLLIWFALLAQRRPSLLRDLWTRRGEDYDRAKIEHARHELARFLADKILYGSHELTRAAVSLDEVQAENRTIEAQG